MRSVLAQILKSIFQGATSADNAAVSSISSESAKDYSGQIISYFAEEVACYIIFLRTGNTYLVYVIVRRLREGKSHDLFVVFAQHYVSLRYR